MSFNLKIASVICLMLIFGLKVNAAVIYTHEIYNIEQGWQGQLNGSATTTLAGEHITHMSFFIKPSLTYGTPNHFRVQAYGGSCNKIVDYTYSEFSIDYEHPIMNFITIPWDYTFPSDMTGCFFGIGQATYEAEQLRLDTITYYDQGMNEPNWSFCDSSSCPLTSNGTEWTEPGSLTYLISFSPASGSIVASSSQVDTNAHFTVALEDSNACGNEVARYWMTRSTKWYEQDQVIYDESFDITGYGAENIDVILAAYSPIGKYNQFFTLKCTNSYWWSLGLIPYTYDLIASSSVFYIDEVPYLPNVIDSSRDYLSGLLGSTTASLAAGVCNPISLNFDIASCLSGLIIPSPSDLDDNLLILKNMPPWGYGFRFYDILNSTTTKPLPVFTATIPNGIIGVGNSITIDPNHSLDFILNATSGIYMSAEASSTDTFYEITNRYWSVVVWLSVGLWIIRRILGNDLIGGFGSRGSLSDNSSSDDSYKLKEKLYEMSKRK